MTYNLYQPISPGSSECAFISSFSSEDEAIAAADTPGSIVETPVPGGVTIVYQVPLDEKAEEQRAIAAAEALLPEGYEIIESR
jgi:hypothetical protein